MAEKHGTIDQNIVDVYDNYTFQERNGASGTWGLAYGIDNVDKIIIAYPNGESFVGVIANNDMSVLNGHIEGSEISGTWQAVRASTGF